MRAVLFGPHLKYDNKLGILTKSEDARLYNRYQDKFLSTKELMGMSHLGGSLQNDTKVGEIEQSYNDAIGMGLPKKVDYVVDAVRNKFKEINRKVRIENRKLYADLKSGAGDTVRASDYYMHKKPTVSEYNQQIIQNGCRDYFNNVVATLERMDIKPKMNSRKVKVTKSGFSVSKNGNKVTEYEFDSKSSCNALYGIFNRQLGCKSSVSELHLRKFTTM